MGNDYTVRKRVLFRNNKDLAWAMFVKQNDNDDNSI